MALRMVPRFGDGRAPVAGLTRASPSIDTGASALFRSLGGMGISRGPGLMVIRVGE